jgi:hypothetical protein
VSPAIEACFSILGNKGPPLSLSLNLGPKNLPGIQVGDNLATLRAWFHRSMELPDLIQQYNQKYSGSRIVVSWWGVFDREAFAAQMEDIEKIWEILEIDDRGGKGIQFSLRRRQVEIASSS